MEILWIEVSREVHHLPLADCNRAKLIDFPGFVMFKEALICRYQKRVECQLGLRLQWQRAWDRHGFNTDVRLQGR